MRKTLLIISLIALGLFFISVMRSGNNLKTQRTSQENETQTDDGGINADAADQERDALAQEFQLQKPLVDKVVEDIGRGISKDDFNTGDARFDGEWVLGSYQMAALGLGQFIQAYPEFRDEYLPVIEQCAERLVAAETNAFGTEAWGEEGLSSLGSDNGHAYLGYTNLALSMLRLHDEDNEFVEINDQLTAALVRRLELSPQGVLETYPDEAYPADIAAAIASIGLYAQATGRDYENFLTESTLQFQQNFVDPQTGLVFQAVEASSGNPVDEPRSSGTALSAYFFSFIDPELSKALFLSVATEQRVQIFGFAGIREYPEGLTGEGDIGSGTLVQGVSPSATAFTIGAARIHGEQALYQELYRTVDFFGTSLLGEMNGVSLLESPLGNATLLAMLTAQEIDK